MKKQQLMDKKKCHALIKTNDVVLWNDRVPEYTTLLLFSVGVRWGGNPKTNIELAIGKTKINGIWLKSQKLV